MNEKSEMMTTNEAAALWGVTPEKVRRWCFKVKNKVVIQKEKGAKYQIPRDYPNPFSV